MHAETAQCRLQLDWSHELETLGTPLREDEVGELLTMHREKSKWGYTL